MTVAKKSVSLSFCSMMRFILFAEVISSEAGRGAPTGEEKVMESVWRLNAGEVVKSLMSGFSSYSQGRPRMMLA
jgi:hypothetical protein